jgi:diguanylate cyclase (GGDEF)-like protein
LSGFGSLTDAVDCATVGWMGRERPTPPGGITPKQIRPELTPQTGFPVFDPSGGAPVKRPCLVALSGPLIGEVFALSEPGGLLIGRDANAQVRLIEEGVSRRHAMLEAEGVVVWLTDLQSTNGTWMGGEKVEKRALTDGDKVRIGQTSVFKFTYHDPIEEQCQRQLLEAALRDGLTRAFNRRYFMQRLAAEIAYAERHRTPLGLLMIDLDHFKVVNDTWGHPIGDKALQKVSDVVLAKIRIDDVLARYGGEEFAVIARDTTLDGTLTLAERLRLAVVESLFEHQGRPIELRVSIGAAAMPHEDARDADSLVMLADEALYRAKRAGRNRVSR